MLKKTFTLEMFHIVVWGISLLIIGIIIYAIGYHNGIDSVQSHCFSYPFLLIDPSKYWACPI